MVGSGGLKNYGGTSAPESPEFSAYGWWYALLMLKILPKIRLST